MDLARGLKEIRRLRDAGVLLDIEGHRLDQSAGVVMVCCADGDQMHDVYTTQAEMQREQRGEPRVHLLSWNGGALRLLADSPTNRRITTAQEFLDEIRDASVLKSIPVVALYAHFPCGKVKDTRLEIQQVFAGLIAAKQRLKREIPGVRVACFFHVDYPDVEAGETGSGPRKRTYFLSVARYMELYDARSVGCVA
ncbi:MAG: hypothetical protein HYY51_03935 [Candidatus Magasanikbacteria bacterium]|nr:hypothetical protein [Candidatus Magasanikbacteria bacterium]